MLFYFTAVKGQTEAIVIVPHGTPKLQMVVEPGAKKAFCVWKKEMGPNPWPTDTVHILLDGLYAIRMQRGRLALSCRRYAYRSGYHPVEHRMPGADPHHSLRRCHRSPHQLFIHLTSPPSSTASPLGVASSEVEEQGPRARGRAWVWWRDVAFCRIFGFD